MKRPSSTAIYAEIESSADGRIYHAFLTGDFEKSDGSSQTASLCGAYRVARRSNPYTPGDWGIGSAGMYADQKWCADCWVKVQTVKAELDAPYWENVARARIGKGTKKRPRPPKEGESFSEQYKVQSRLWVKALDFPALGPSQIPHSSKIDVEWRCSHFGHPNYVEQPNRVRDALKKGKKPCPLCRAGHKRQPWTKDRVVAYVRSIARHLSKLSPADRYQLLLQSGLLSSQGRWAQPVAEALLLAPEDAPEAAANLDSLLRQEAENSRNRKKFEEAVKSLWRCTERLPEPKGKQSELLGKWVAEVPAEERVLAIRERAKTQDQKLLDGAWTCVAAEPQLAELKVLLEQTFPAERLSKSKLPETLSRVAGQLGCIPPSEGELSTLRGELNRLMKEHGVPELQLETETSPGRLTLTGVGPWLANLYENYPEVAKARERVFEAIDKQSDERRDPINLILHWLETTPEEEKKRALLRVYGHKPYEADCLIPLWKYAPHADGAEGDALRAAILEAVPHPKFSEASITPLLPEEIVEEQLRALAKGSETVDIEFRSWEDDSERAPDRELSPTEEVANVLDTANDLLIAEQDEDALEYFLASQTSKLWAIAFRDLDKAIAAAEEWSGGLFGNHVRDAFLTEAVEVRNLALPDDWDFRPPGASPALPPFKPRTMQKLTAVRLGNCVSFGMGNWSLMGGGKTVSAILASAHIGSSLTLVVCPNATLDGWRNEIKRVFPKAAVSGGWSPPESARRRFMLLNVEQFQQDYSVERIEALLEQEPPGFVVLDEVHKFKQRDKKLTHRRKCLLYLLSELAEAQASLRVLALTGTPVINNLFEARSLLELCSLERHSDLNTKETLPNAMKIHSRLVRLGLRDRPDYLNEFSGIERVETDVSHRKEEICKAEDRHAAELILVEEKLDSIVEYAKPRSVIYSDLVTDVHLELGRAIAGRGCTVGYYNGQDKSGLERFKNGEIDCLIASSAIGTGVDGLQYCSERLIVVTLPWTSSDFDQLLGRFFRPKSDGATGQVDVIVPWTFIPTGKDNTSWSMDGARWNRIRYKATLADTAVDGVLPKGQLRSPAQAFSNLKDWLNRLESSPTAQSARRPAIRVPLPPAAMRTKRRQSGDLTQFHAKLASSNAGTTHSALREDPETWSWYHTEVESVADEWPFRPYKRCVEWIEKRLDRGRQLRVADLGCGLAKLSEALDNRCTVASFDHVAISERVQVANIAEGVPLGDQSMDVVVLSLVLDWQRDWEKCLVEAARLVALDGHLHIWETPAFVERIGGVDAFKRVVSAQSLSIREVHEERFVGIVAIR